MWPSTHRRNPARILARAACISLRPMPFPPKPFIDIEAMRFGGCFVEGAERQRPGGRLFPSGDQDFFASVELNFSDSESERSLGRRTSASVSPWSGAMTASHSPGFVRSPSAALRSSRLRATEMTHDMASSCPRLRTGSPAGARGASAQARPGRQPSAPPQTYLRRLFLPPAVPSDRRSRPRR